MKYQKLSVIEVADALLCIYSIINLMNTFRSISQTFDNISDRRFKAVHFLSSSQQAFVFYVKRILYGQRDGEGEGLLK